MDLKLRAELAEGTVTAAGTLVRLGRLAEISGGFVHATDDEGAAVILEVGREKLDLLRDVVEEIGPEEKVIIFARYRAEQRGIAQMLEDVGIETVALRGAQSLAEREAALAQFADPAGARVLVASLQVASSSIDLTAARYAIYYSVGFSFGDYEQSRGRIRRQGQTRPQVYVHLVARETIDEVIYRALRRKGDVHSAVAAWKRSSNGRGAEVL